MRFRIVLENGTEVDHGDGAERELNNYDYGYEICRKGCG